LEGGSLLFIPPITLLTASIVSTARSKLICSVLDIPERVKLKDVSKDKLKLLADFIDSNYVIGSKLFRDKSLSIKKLIKMSAYRGFRHVRGLPLRGQRTHTNAKTSRKFKTRI
jgi:small subunit ribosomal protein S13